MITWRVLAALWRVNAAEELQYRGNFVASLLGTAFWLLTALLTLGLFFSHATRLGGWSYWQVVVLLGVFNALAGLVEAIFRPGIGQLASAVRTGSLDLVLTRPVDAQLYTTFRRLDVWRFADVIAGLAIAGYAAWRASGHAPSVVQIAAFGITFIAAAALVYALWLTLMSAAFWFVAVENLSVLFDSVYEAARYPVSAYPGALRILFVYLLPIAWTTTVPAAALTGQYPPRIALIAVLVAAIALGLTRWLWSSALRRYTSAGG